MKAEYYTDKGVKVAAQFGEKVPSGSMLLDGGKWETLHNGGEVFGELGPHVWPMEAFGKFDQPDCLVVVSSEKAEAIRARLEKERAKSASEKDASEAWDRIADAVIESARKASVAMWAHGKFSTPDSGWSWNLELPNGAEQDKAITKKARAVILANWPSNLPVPEEKLADVTHGKITGWYVVEQLHQDARKGDKEAAEKLENLKA